MFDLKFDYIPSEKGVYISIMSVKSDDGVYFIMEDEDSVTGRWVCTFHTDPNANWWDTGEDIPVENGPEEYYVLAQMAANNHYRDRNKT